jgi:hypothetical protein
VALAATHVRLERFCLRLMQECIHFAASMQFRNAGLSPALLQLQR